MQENTSMLRVGKKSYSLAWNYCDAVTCVLYWMCLCIYSEVALNGDKNELKMKVIDQKVEFVTP